MSSPKSRWFAGLGAMLAIAGCSEGIVESDPGSISLSITTTSATVMQGGSQPVAATVTRIGGFTGTVALTVTGQPSGVTALVSNVQSTGAVTTATITVVVDAAVAPAVYPLLVHGTGSGVNEVTQPFTLTITADLGFSISLSAAALSMVQGSSAPTTTVNVTRTSHLGAVELEVTGLPAAVTAAFDHAPPWLTGNSSVLTLKVSATAVPGIYNLQVNASDPERPGSSSTALTLTVTAPPPAPGYTLALGAATLSIAQASSSSGTNVSLIRTTFTGNVTLSVENLPAGVTAYFYPYSPISGSSSQLWLSVAAVATPGTYANLLVRGVAAGLTDRTAPLTLTITVAPFVLTLSSPTLTIMQGTATPTTTVNIVRNNLTGPVELWVDTGDFHGTMPLGITATFAPQPATGNSTVLTMSVSATAVPGVYDLWVYGYASTGYFEGTLLTLTVTAALGTQEIGQWATTATASSQYDDISWAARQATGAPDVVGCEDDPRAWASLEAGTKEWLELTYTTPVLPTMIRVYETWSPGSIVKVEVKDAAGQYTTIYTAQVTTPACPRTLEIPVTGVMAKIFAVRISVDQAAHQDWNEIDAVQLVGRP